MCQHFCLFLKLNIFSICAAAQQAVCPVSIKIQLRARICKLYGGQDSVPRNRFLGSSDENIYEFESGSENGDTVNPGEDYLLRK
jgi:hypothetical protein